MTAFRSSRRGLFDISVAIPTILVYLPVERVAKRVAMANVTLATPLG
jgi:hypothetical protein